ALDLGGVALAQHAGAVGRGQHQLEAVGDLLEAVLDGDAGHISLRGQVWGQIPRAWKVSARRRRWDRYFRRWACTIALRSKSARSNNSLIVTRAISFACASSVRALSSRRSITSGAASPRRSSRERSSSQLGGRMKIRTALAKMRLICSAPCQSIS